MSTGKGYFAGLSLPSSAGLSSDDVLLYKLIAEREDTLRDFGLLVFPAVPDTELATSYTRRAPRIHYVYYRSPSDYLALTRPLSAQLGEILEMLKIARSKYPQCKLFVSLASDKVSKLEGFLRAFAGRVDGYEVDLGLMFHLYGRRRGFEAFAVDVLEELVHRADRPILAKLSPSVPMSDEFVSLVVETGVNAVVFSPHVTYSVGKELFRVHSPLLSRVFSYAWAQLAAGLSLSTAYISDIPPDELGELDPSRAFDVILYDTALVPILFQIPPGTGSPPPLRWAQVNEGVYPVVSAEEEGCAKSCPRGAFEKAVPGWKGHLFATSSRCDLCGICLSVCRTARLAQILAPE
uniref:4Fe-4S dicluster domain-containing protein n=1 Tax=Thermofilum pendens TaxID=2269 RepID=A0A7C3SNZ4_THEPE